MEGPQDHRALFPLLPSQLFLDSAQRVPPARKPATLSAPTSITLTELVSSTLLQVRVIN